MRSLAYFQQTWLFTFLCGLIAFQIGREYRLAALDGTAFLNLLATLLAEISKRALP